MDKQANNRKDLIRTNISCNVNCLFCNFTTDNEKNFRQPSFQDIKKRIDELADNKKTLSRDEFGTCQITADYVRLGKP